VAPAATAELKAVTGIAQDSAAANTKLPEVLPKGA